VIFKLLVKARDAKGLGCLTRFFLGTSLTDLEGFDDIFHALLPHIFYI